MFLFTFAGMIAAIMDYFIYIVLFFVVIFAIILTVVLGGKFSQIREINNLVEVREMIIEGLEDNYEVWRIDAIAFNNQLEKSKRTMKNDKVQLIEPIDLEEFRR